MGEAFRVILLIGLAAAALTTGALALNWWMEPERRLRRAMLKSLGRAAFRALKYLGLSEAGELGGQAPGTYTFWDYQAGAWPKNNGIRIDFHLLSPQAADRFRSVETHRDARDMDKPSDHVPVVVELDLAA